MKLFSILQRFGPLLEELATSDEDEGVEITAEVEESLEALRSELEATVARVRALRDERVDTSDMGIEEIDRLLQERGL